MSRPIIEVRNLSKRYRLGHLGFGSLRDEAAALPQRLRSLFAKNQPASTSSAADHPRDFWALRDISFDVQPGEVIGIVGRNGAGKSTLLKILSEITEPTSGEVHLRGRMASLLEVGTGFHPELSGRDNIFLNGAILGMRRAEIRAKFDEIVAFAEVDKFLDTPVKRYSSGMYVRLAFAVAAHLEPEILVIDEVLAVGDQAFQQKCLGKMNDVAHQEGRTVLFVSHNMAAIRALTQRCILLEDGRVAIAGPTQEAVTRYLSSQSESKAEWAAPETSTRAAQITRARVISETGRSLVTLDAERSFFIELSYEVRKPVTNVLIEFYLYSGSGEHILTSGDYDRDANRLIRREPGRYRAVARVPGNLLRPGRYSLSVNSGLGEQETWDNAEALRFEIIEMNGPTPRQRRNTAIGPLLDWEITRE